MRRDDEFISYMFGLRCLETFKLWNQRGIGDLSRELWARGIICEKGGYMDELSPYRVKGERQAVVMEELSHVLAGWRRLSL